MSTARKFGLSFALLVFSILLLRVDGWFGVGIPVGLILFILYWFDLGQELRAKPPTNRALRIVGLLMGVPQALFGLTCLAAGLAIIGIVLYNSFWHRDPHYTGGFLTFGVGPGLVLFGTGMLFDSFRLHRSFVDKRPIDREVENKILGLLVYSDENQAWRANSQFGKLKFDFYISGSEDVSAPTQRPDPILVKEAGTVALAQDDFIAKITAHVYDECNKKKMKDWMRELTRIKIEAFHLSKSQQSESGFVSFGFVSFTGHKNNRLWGCDYINGKPCGLYFKDR